MKTQAEIEQLAAEYAYDIISCPGSPHVDDAIESWRNDEHHPDLIIWQPFEQYYGPDDLLGTFRDLEAAFLNFAKAITNG